MSIASLFESGEVTQDKGHIKNLVLLSMVDGDVSDEELLLIYKIGRKIGLTYAQIGAIVDDPKKARVIPPYGKKERYEHMVDMVTLIHADGVVDASEMKLLSKFAVQIGFESVDDAKIDIILDKITEGKSRELIVDELLK